MGFRIRKSISLGKGVRVNLGKNGISSVTVGKRGAPHVTVGKRGTYVGTSIPGTGISYSQKISGKKSSASKPAKNKTKASSLTATAQLPITTQRLEAPASPSFSGTGNTAQTNKQTIPRTEVTSSNVAKPKGTNTSPNGTNTPPSGGNHAKTPKQPGSWKRWIVIIIVAIVALAIGNMMSADPTQSNQYKELQQQLTSQKKQNGKLQQQVDELNRKLDDIQDLKDQLEQQKAEQDSQQKQLDQQKSEQEQKQQEQDQKQQEQDQRQTQLDEREKNIAQREEAKKQAQEQQLAQVAQQQQSQTTQSQSQSPAATSLGRAHGGAFCSPAGATAQSDRSTSILTCRTASDGRLRWMR